MINEGNEIQESFGKFAKGKIAKHNKFDYNNLKVKQWD